MAAADFATTVVQQDTADFAECENLQRALMTAFYEFLFLLYEVFVGALYALYYRVLLLSLPSMPCYSQSVGDFADGHLRNNVKETWIRFLDSLDRSWTLVARDCKRILGVCISILAIQATCMTRSSVIPPTLTAVSSVCCLFSITLTRVMHGHTLPLRERPNFKAAGYWSLTDEDAKGYPFTATRMLMAAPAAWRAWARNTLVAASISCVWCAMDFNDLGATIEHKAGQQLGLSNAVHILQGTQTPTAQPLFCMTVVIFVVIIGFAHCWLVTIYFCRLGYREGPPDCRIVRRDRKIPTTPHARRVCTSSMSVMSVATVKAVLSRDNVIRALEEGSVNPNMLQIVTSMSTYHTPPSSPRSV